MFNVYLDDTRPGPSNDWGAVQIGWEDWVIVRSVENVKRLLYLGVIDRLSLDHDLGINSTTGELNETGSALVKWMIENDIYPKGEIYIHSQNLLKAQEMGADLDRFRPK